MRAKYNKAIAQIGGPEVIVEIDELKFGKRKYKRGHRFDKVSVIGLVEKSSDLPIVFMPVKSRDQHTLHALVKSVVKPGTIIRTGGWRGYKNLPDVYVHRVVNHSVFFVNSKTGVHTNIIEGNWAPLK